MKWEYPYFRKPPLQWSQLQTLWTVIFHDASWTEDGRGRTWPVQPRWYIYPQVSMHCPRYAYENGSGSCVFSHQKNCQLVLSEGFPCLSHLIPENLRRMRLGDGNNPWPHIGNFYAINPWNPMESQRLSIPFGRALRDRQWRWSHGGCDCRHRGALNWTGSNMIQYWICSWKFGKPVIQAYLNDSLRGRVKPESLGISFSSQEAILRHGIKRRWFQYKVRTCPGMLS